MSCSSSNTAPIRYAANILALLVIGLIYYVLRLPTAAVPLSFYDDGETLYHTLTVLKGGLPYRDSISHHFLGYVLQFLVGAKIFGFSPSLVREVAFLSQILTGFGVFLCMRLMLPWHAALLAGVLTVSAREPWVTGFFVQYQINLLYVYALLCSLSYLRSGRTWKVAVAGLLCGLAFTFDQRALALTLLLPTCVVLKPSQKPPQLLKALSAASLGWLTPPLLAVLYLSINGLWEQFIEQTWIFPTRYRVASQSMLELLQHALLVHKYLLTLTPILLVAGLLGWGALIKSLQRHKGDQNLTACRRLMLCLALPLGAMPLFGSRDYDYYTITWLPYLAMLSAISPDFFRSLGIRARRLVTMLLWTPVLFSLSSAWLHRNWAEKQEYQGDGIQEVAQFLKNNLTLADSVYVWGYRLDLYAYLEKLSAFPFVNQMLIHPDKVSSDATVRAKHIYPKYEALFLNLLNESLPDYLVTINEDRQFESPSHQRVTELLRKRYQLVHQLQRKDFRGNS
ncbi:MAG: hypothetical protein GX589_09960, partial [Deltaproteobacteria bacterium]|nr:hypothetical protein [Deltaproteobacteria bacterium]